ncbi:MAG: NAD(P)-dependent oxidoreductase, partial [Leptolyngbya sp.]|nr:NAD(P)-dependent oxidoreductase [Leptolyngbya sp.]
MRVLVTGAAGLVGQNLIASLKRNPSLSLVAMDKHPANTAILRQLHPDIEVHEVDLAEPGDWESVAAGVDLAVMLQAQIGGLDGSEFDRNNITATERVLSALQSGNCQYLVHASSSVVNSKAVDFYTESKKAQEAIVAACALPHVILRPTLMFGWFDRKHLGWLKRFMERAPAFPIPGNGRYLRQPLYAGDFSAIIESCLSSRIQGTYDISGQEKIDYIDLIRTLRDAAGLRTPIVRIPYSLFWLLLKTYSLVDRDPPFTTLQLKALVTPDVFPVIDWPGIFGVPATPLRPAMEQT